ncbi:MAG: class II aldolase/adducin family protein, partial [Actinomycetospora chiangmaiensis]|nr:class II aldolase/adducin family protein [Actinomycetospora chiangmaiensis]
MLDDHAHDAVVLDLPNDDAGRRRTSIYQPEQAGLIFPEIPEFANHAEAR